MRHVEPPVVLSDGRVTIRPYCAADVDRHHAAVCASVDAVAPWLDWCHPDYTRAESQSWIASRSAAWAQQAAYSFAIVDAQKGAFWGGCGLNGIDHGHQLARLGYWVRTDRTRSGVATRAGRLVTRFGFETLGLHRIEILVLPSNTASCRVAEKLGAIREGLCRHRIVLRGAPRDAVLYALLPSDLTRDTLRRS